MTKTLTEQWREGKLPVGKYYIKTKWLGCDGKWHYEKEEDIDYLDGDWRFYQDDAVAEVLATVPSYDEWKQAKENLDKNGTWYTERSYKRIEKQLAIATKALKEINKNYRFTVVQDVVYKALKEMEGAK